MDKNNVSGFLLCVYIVHLNQSSIGFDKWNIAIND
jgi:hypothetical protein